MNPFRCVRRHPSLLCKSLILGGVTRRFGELEFKDFVCTNAVRLHAGMNPDFFRGSVCEQAVEQVLNDVG